MRDFSALTLLFVWEKNSSYGKALGKYD